MHLLELARHSPKLLLLHLSRARGTLVLCTASTGLAALILPGGLTAHSTFKLPFGPDAVSGSTCNIKAESQRADVLKQAGLLYGTNAQCQANMLLKLWT